MTFKVKGVLLCVGAAGITTVIVSLVCAVTKPQNASKMQAIVFFIFFQIILVII
jgi:hypothetical protein